MQKPLSAVFMQFVAAIALLSMAWAQQTPAASAPSQTTPPKKTTTPAKKTTSTAKPATVTLKTDKDKQSYALGMSFGGRWRQQGVPADPALVARGIKDAMAGGKTLLTEDEMKAALTQLQNEYREMQQAKEAEAHAKAHEASEANRKEGEAFLAANKAKEGVTTLPSGLQYKILTEGSGPKPTATDTVVCNYRGTLINGKEFDSSYKRGEPAKFQVGGVIKGWTEALQLMPAGSKWQLFIPADLAYGDGPAPGGDIGPGDTLIFEVELLSIEPKK
jgi:FKBP-type peptidyl-prolyl cis-trans isomerase FklB